MKYVFWFLIFLILYIYFCYPFLLLALSKIRRKSSVKKKDISPSVSLIITAYNEEKVIAQKIRNSLALDYPSEKLEIIVASDGSTDKTNEIVRSFSRQGVILVVLSQNQGKSSAQNQAAVRANGDILFFTDANVRLRLDTIKKIVRNFSDGGVGCVVGKVTYLNEKDTIIGQGEGLYWRYELFLRGIESQIGNFVIGSGPIMAVRSSLFQPLDPDVGEDFVLPIQVAMSGYRVVYEPEAVSEETLFQNTPASMFSSKVRVISKDLHGLFLCRAILNPFRYPLYAWGLISHKLLRWLAPYFFIIFFFSSLFLVHDSFYAIIFFIQIFLYFLALTGCLNQAKKRLPSILSIPFSFCLVNWAALIGVARFLMGRKAGRWQPVR